MRIIAGEFRGRILKAPKGTGTRPTTDRVRESLMSSLASARGGFDGAVVLDAFAGSGALGLEALSRGAASAVFYERDREAAGIVAANIKALGLEPRRARLVRADVLEKPPVRQVAPFDLVFLDPPYALAASEALGIAAALSSAGVLATAAFVAYEHAVQAGDEALAAADLHGLELYARKKYGDTAIDVLVPRAQ